MTDEAKQEVGRIVVVIPAAVTVFEHHGIRFYDSAPQTLEDACRRAGAPLHTVLEGLREASQNKDGKHGRWDQVPLPALIRYVLENHHEWERIQVKKIQGELDQVAAAGGEGFKELPKLQGLFKRMASRFMNHLGREERELFPPFLNEVSPGPGQDKRHAAAKRLVPLTRELEKDHDDLLGEWEAMRSLTKGFQVSTEVGKEQQELLVALSGLERYQHQHIHKENFILFEKIRSIGS